MLISEKASHIHRHLGKLFPGPAQHTCILTVPGQNRAWLGLDPIQVIKIKRNEILIDKDGHTSQIAIDPDDIFDRLPEFIDPRYPLFFLISADLTRAVEDPELPLLLLIQPSVEIELSNNNTEPRIRCDNRKLADDILNVITSSSHSSATLADKVDFDDSEWEWEAEHIIMERLNAAIDILKQKSGKVIVMRSGEKLRHTELDPFRLFEIYSSLEPGCAAGHIYNLGNGDFSIGMSPENIFVLENGELYYDVVAGTRGKSADPDTDSRWQQELHTDPKELNEHQMALDRYQSRLESLCLESSVQLNEYRKILELHCVRHLFSQLSGTLAPDYDVFSLLKQHFPPLASYPDELIPFSDSGTIPWYYYGGMVGRIGPGLDTAHCFLNIRATLLYRNKIHVQAGAGVIEQSKPRLEFLEISNKLKCLPEAIARWENEA